jgi:hypothetical protein
MQGKHCCCQLLEEAVFGLGLVVYAERCVINWWTRRIVIICLIRIQSGGISKLDSCYPFMTGSGDGSKFQYHGSQLLCLWQGVPCLLFCSSGERDFHSSDERRAERCCLAALICSSRASRSLFLSSISVGIFRQRCCGIIDLARWFWCSSGFIQVGAIHLVERNNRGEIRCYRWGTCADAYLGFCGSKQDECGNVP